MAVVVTRHVKNVGAAIGQRHASTSAQMGSGAGTHPLAELFDVPSPPVTAPRCLQPTYDQAEAQREHAQQEHGDGIGNGRAVSRLVSPQPSL